MKFKLSYFLISFTFLLFANCSLLISPNSKGEKIKYTKKTVLPENNKNLERVVKHGDTLILDYQAPSKIPDIQRGAILIGIEDGGYLRKVISKQIQGSSLILQTENALLTEAIEECNVHKEVPLIPTEEVIQKINSTIMPIDTNFVIYDSVSQSLKKVYLQTSRPYFLKGNDSEYKWRFIIPEAKFEVKVDPNLTFGFNFENVIIEFDVDAIVDLKIDYFTIKNFEVSLKFNKRISIENVIPTFAISLPEDLMDVFTLTLFKLPQDILLGTVAIATPPIVVTFRMGFVVDTGLNNVELSVNFEFSNDMVFTEEYTIGTKYTNQNGWQPIFNYNSDGVFQPKFKKMTGELTIDLNLVRMVTDIKVLLYDVAGPGFGVNLGAYGNLQIIRRLLEFGTFIGFKIKAYLSILGISLAEQEFFGAEVRFPIKKIELCSPNTTISDNSFQMKNISGGGL